MASAPSIAAEQAPLRPSFAKVAASALKSQSPKEATHKARPPVATPRIMNHKPRTAPTNTGSNSKALASKSEDKVTGPITDSFSKQDIREVQDGRLIQPDTPVMPASTSTALAQPQAAAVVKIAVVEDGSTQLSSSDGSGKPPSIDGGKSVASATTFALDEKESLRPDDSASLRAVEEEDIVSPPDSVVADSRQGSDNGAARAFRDQLHEIAVIQPQIHRGVPPGRFPNISNGPHSLFDPNHMLNGSRPVSQPAVSPMVPGPSNVPIFPDEKLIEALQSPRDRLFVVKIEQDFIDFIKDSRESEYSLPSCNTFYRMLAHRLADYYGLGHVVDGTMTGVKITRTPYCRIPPPVSQMVDPNKGSSTPPVELPARKIMRRDDGKSGTNTAANSQAASKTTSEIGASDGSNDGHEGKDKTSLTREEREARYREARQRIFGSAESEENDAADALGSGDDKEKTKDVSRTNSATGKKKLKKQRNYDDDDFQARSHFNAYYPQQFTGPGYNADSVVYYNGYAGSMAQPHYVPVNSGTSPPLSYNSAYHGVMPQDAQAQYAWGTQQYQAPNNPAIYSGFSQTQNGFDLSMDFQKGMSSFQNANMQSQVTPKMANPSMAPYQDPYQQQQQQQRQQQQMPIHSTWPHMPQHPSHPLGQNMYTSSVSNNGPMPYPQHLNDASTYGQFSSSPFTDKGMRNQHPIPGSYTRPQFNPQTQSFIPSTPNYYNGGMNCSLSYRTPSGPSQPLMNPHAPFTQTFPQTMPPQQMPQYNSSANSTPSFGSPQSLQGMGVATQMKRVMSQSGETANSQSSIAKYGTPSHLPAKPPAPAASQQPAPKCALPNMARLPSNMASGQINGSPGTNVRSGTA